jgi:hypothetical protein
MAATPVARSAGQDGECGRLCYRGAAVADSRRARPRTTGIAWPDKSSEPGHAQNRRSIAVSEHVPPSPYPASQAVISLRAVADLPNRQGPCLPNSSGTRPELYTKAHSGRMMIPGENGTSALIQGASPRWGRGRSTGPRPYPHGRPSGGARPGLRRYQLRDLRGVERRPLAQVVAAHEELDGTGIVE